jgi:hypothetical protein
MLKGKQPYSTLVVAVTFIYCFDSPLESCAYCAMYGAVILSIAFISVSDTSLCSKAKNIKCLNEVFKCGAASMDLKISNRGSWE